MRKPQSSLKKSILKQFIHKLWGQNGVKLKAQKRVIPHFGSKKQEKTPEINDFRCFFGCGGGT